MLLDYQEFKNIILGDARQISREDFKAKTNMVALWNNKMDTDDIRKTSFKGDLNLFLDWVYDFMIDGIDVFLAEFFEARLFCRELPGFNFAPIEIKGDSIKNKPSCTRYIRNVFAQEMLNCSNYKGAKFSIINAFRNMYRDGQVNASTFVPPSLFVHFDLNDYKYIPDLAIVYIRNTSGMMSVFSPLIYRSLLRHQQQLIKDDNHRLLCPTASWGSPVIAAKTCDYRDVTIVDVQESVLAKCHDVLDDITEQHPLFEEDTFDLFTHCIPSERMTEQVQGQYSHIFFCPPYYDLELYDDQNGLQSTTLYKTYEEWLEGYWRGTLEACKNLGKPGGVFSFVMNNVTRGVSIGTDMDRMAQEYFAELEQIKILTVSKNNDSDNNDRFEVVYTYRM